MPTVTIALTGTVGPQLADSAVPTFLSVQEKAGAVEVLRTRGLDASSSVTPQSAGEALQNLMFVGLSQPAELGQRAPRVRYERAWFTDAADFPDVPTRSAARYLM